MLKSRRLRAEILTNLHRRFISRTAKKSVVTIPAPAAVARNIKSAMGLKENQFRWMRYSFRKRVEYR